MPQYYPIFWSVEPSTIASILTKPFSSFFVEQDIFGSA